MKDDFFKKLLNELSSGRAINNPANEEFMRKTQASNLLAIIGWSTGHRASHLMTMYYVSRGVVSASFKLPLEQFPPHESQLSGSELGNLSLIAALPGGNGR